MLIEEFYRKLSHDLDYGEEDTDRSECPECGNIMNFFGGDEPPFFWRGILGMPFVWI